MKKIIGILLFLVAFVFSADVKPFYFEGVQETEQQATWDELMKYKLWGTDSFLLGGNSPITDESGRNGTTGNLIGTGSETLLGGPVLINGDITLKNGCTFTTGPIVANSMSIENLNNGYFGGTLCLTDTNISNDIRRGLQIGGGELSNDCSDYPKVTGLTVPSVKWPDSTLHSLIVAEHKSDTITIPEGIGPVDIYLNELNINNSSSLYFAIPDTGRLVRIFVNGSIKFGDRAIIQTMNNNLPISNDDYMGNLLFYSTEDILFGNTDYCIRQGTFISAKTLKLEKQVTFAGQMLATNLVIGDNLKGTSFRFVSFDNPQINLGDPKTNALGDFVENNKNVAIPIFLDTLAPVKVTFNYCFILNDASLEDFNVEATPIPVCEDSVGKVTILEGTTTPVDPVFINVIDDGLDEGIEIVGFKIYNVSGASLPGNKSTHVFTLTLSDGDLFKINADSIAKSVPENKKDTVLGKITVTGGSDTTKIILADKDTSKYSLIDGVLTLKVPYDYETTQKDTITLIAIDGVKTDRIDVIINITDENEAPILLPSDLSINEDTTGTAGEIKYDDPDKKNPVFNIEQFTIIAGDTTKFKLDSNKVIVKTPIDFDKGDSVFYITVKVSDKNDTTLFDTLTYKININPVNENPEVSIPEIVIKENCPSDSCVDFTFTNKFPVNAIDPDHDTLTYEIDNENFKIDNNGVISVVKPLDYEKDSLIVVTVYVSDGKVTIATDVIIHIEDVNEPVHVTSEPIDVKENYTGPVGKVEGKDDDGDKISYWLSDSTKYTIDNNGNISINVPYDFETFDGKQIDKDTKLDSIIVFVTDGRGDTATTVVKINVKNEKETFTVHYDYTEPQGKEPVYADTVYINRPNVTINWTADDNTQITDTTLTPGKHIIPLCYSDPSKDSAACDTVVVLYSDAAPVVTVLKTDTKIPSISGITIVEEKDKDDHNIYINTPKNKVNVTVKDTVTGESEQFEVEFKLPSDSNKININIPKSAYEKYTYVATTDLNRLNAEVMSDGKIKYTETIVTNGDTVNVSYYGDKDGEPLDTIQYVSYIKVINGEKIEFSYTIDDLGVITSDYNVTITRDNNIKITYKTESDGKIIKNSDGGIDYIVSYTYTNKYGNTGTAEITLSLKEKVDDKVVEILSPIENSVVYTNSVMVQWTINGIEQDSLNLQGLEKGINFIYRVYVDKYGNEYKSDDILIIMKGTKDINVSLINPVTMVDQDKVDEWYSDSKHKYNPDKPYIITFVDPQNPDIKPNVIGPALTIDLVMPQIGTKTQGLATMDDIVVSYNGQPVIAMNPDGTIHVGATTFEHEDSTLVPVPVEDFITDHCTDEYIKDVNKNGIDKTSLWHVKLNAHIWIFDNNSHYVNDFNVKYDLDDTKNVNNAGMLTLILDLIPDKDGHVKSKNKKALGTGAYIGKIEFTTHNTLRCDMPNKTKGTIEKKTEQDLITFGYKRPIKK